MCASPRLRFRSSTALALPLALGLAALASACTEPEILAGEQPGQTPFNLKAERVPFQATSPFQTIAPTQFAGVVWVPAPINGLVVVDRSVDAFLVTFDARARASASRLNWSHVDKVRGIAYAPLFSALTVARASGCPDTPGESGCLVTVSPTTQNPTEQRLVPFGSGDPLPPLNLVDVKLRDYAMYFLDPQFETLGQPKGAILALTGPNTVEVTGYGTEGAQALGVGPSVDGDPSFPWRFVSKGPASPTLNMYPADSTTGEVLHYLPHPQPYGVTVDKNGRVFVATANGITVVDGTPERRQEAWGTITLPTDGGLTAPALNVAFGGEDMRTLYITSPGGLYRVRMAVEGLP